METEAIRCIEAAKRSPLSEEEMYEVILLSRETVSEGGITGVEYKYWQQKEEKTHKKLLEERNILGEWLMTQENLSRWIDEGESYASIGRNYVGLSSELVSAVCKKYGIKSNVKKAQEKMKMEKSME